VAVKSMLYHKYDDDDYDGDDLNISVEGRVIGRFMQPWIHNCGCKMFRRHSCKWKGNSKIILEAGCVDVKWDWLVRIAVLWLAVLMTVMTRCSSQ
jgi:hypothetical protein